MKKRGIGAALLAALLALAACSHPAEPAAGVAPPSAQGEGPLAQVPPLLREAGGKNNPGCRTDLLRPLKMNGESAATGFGRFTAQDAQGNAVTEEILAGSQVTVLAAWSSYCGTCMGDLAALQEIYESYPRQQVNVIGVVASAQEADGSISGIELENLAYLQQRTGASFLQLLPGDDLIAVWLKDLGTIPEVLLLDGAGNRLGAPHTGPLTAEDLGALVDGALEDAINQAESGEG